MKKILLGVVFLVISSIILVVYIGYIRYKDSLQIESFLNDKTTNGIDYHERTGFKIHTENKNSFLDIFYIPIMDEIGDKITVKISEYNENHKKVDFSFWGLDSINATTGGTIHFYTKESLLGFQEYRYPYPSSPFLTLNRDISVTLNLKEERALYNRDSGWQPLTRLYNINGKIIGIYIVSRHPTNRYLEFEII